MELESQHPKSRRWACVETENNHSIYLYLTEPLGTRIEKDVLVVSLIRPIQNEDVEAHRNAGGPPPIVAGYETEAGLQLNGEPAIAILWSPDGESAAVKVDGTLFAMASMRYPKGFSKALSKTGFWGSPWDEEAFQMAFASDGM